MLWRWALEEGVRLQREVVQGWHDLWVETPHRRRSDRQDGWGRPR